MKFIDFLLFGGTNSVCPDTDFDAGSGYFFFQIFFGGIFNFFFFVYTQHCFICRPSDSSVPTDAGIEPRTVAIGALAVRRSNH
jgi:hypothetical protein